jgi:hypothetical protein
MRKIAASAIYWTCCQHPPLSLESAMILKRLLQWFILLFAFWSAPALHAQVETQINWVNASTCDYNPTPDSLTVVAGSFIAGRNAVAFCSIPQPFTDLFNNLFELSEVLYTGMNTVPGGITAQLCVFASTQVLIVACGPASTPAETGRFTDILRAPQLPGFPRLGAYVILTFSDQTVSFAFQFRSASSRDMP